jgi:tetratricopeptide (TPR) repeat protein
MLWRAPAREHVAPPAAVFALLQSALAAEPRRTALHVTLAHYHLDRFDFAAAATSLEVALRLEPGLPHIKGLLASCFNVGGDHQRALDILAEEGEAHQERGIALAGLGRSAEAQGEFQAVLEADPDNRQACRRLCKALRAAGRFRELLDTCEALAARGVCHTQLLYDWGIALALNGEDDRARAILFDPARVVRRNLPAPEGWAEPHSFNAAFADELLASPYWLTDFSTEEAANRGSSRLHTLLAGRRPELVRALLARLQEAVDGLDIAPKAAFDPWAAARPHAARLQAWGLIQRGGDHEEWHLHRDGWVSGVYYVRVPTVVTAEGRGRGCIEFGPPGALAKLRPDFTGSLRIAPSEGMLLLAPSHYPHRTIPTGTDDHRISFAFDVAPVA